MLALNYLFACELSLFINKARGLGFEPRSPEGHGSLDAFETVAIPDYAIPADERWQKGFFKLLDSC